MDYYSCLTCVPSLKIQALFSAKQERASGIYPASGITPTYLTTLTLALRINYYTITNESPESDVQGNRVSLDDLPADRAVE